MEIKLADTKRAYKVLANINQIRQDIVEGDEWKQQDQELDGVVELKKIGGLPYRPVELPEPLNFAGLCAYRSWELFSIDVVVGARESAAFRKLSAKLQKRFNQLENYFLKTTDNGTGHILAPSGRVLASIFESSKNTRGIAIGRYGAVPRIFNEENFCRGVDEVLNYANVFVNCCYDAEQRQDKRMKGLVLYLSH